MTLEFCYHWGIKRVVAQREAIVQSNKPPQEAQETHNKIPVAFV